MSTNQLDIQVCVTIDLKLARQMSMAAAHSGATEVILPDTYKLTLMSKAAEVPFIPNFFGPNIVNCALKMKGKITCV